MLYQKEIPLRIETDVFVAGGGPAGVAAAVAAARNGCSVFLAEGGGCFGGMGTASLVPVLVTMTDGVSLVAAGFCREIMERMIDQGCMGSWHDVRIRPEVLKRVYDDVVTEAGVDYAFFTQVVDAVNIPVIAAGGIADGRGIAAAFMLGAEAVQIGTRFVVAKESIVHENYKQRIIKAKDIDSTVTGRSHGHPVRCLRNQMTREYNKLESEGKSFEELEYLTLGTLRKAVQEGDVTHGTVMAGQIAGMIDKEQTCKEMIDEMMAQAEALLKGAR